MKQIKQIILFIIIAVALTVTCYNYNIETVDAKSNSMFETIERHGEYHVLYHKNTKVMYVMSRGSYNIGVFTLLVDENGKPLLYNEEDYE